MFDEGAVGKDLIRHGVSLSLLQRSHLCSRLLRPTSSSDCIRISGVAGGRFWRSGNEASRCDINRIFSTHIASGMGHTATRSSDSVTGRSRCAGKRASIGAIWPGVRGLFNATRLGSRPHLHIHSVSTLQLESDGVEIVSARCYLRLFGRCRPRCRHRSRTLGDTPAIGGTRILSGGYPDYSNRRISAATKAYRR